MAAGNELVAVLTEVKRRRREHGHYGITGDEWAVLRRMVADLQGCVEAVPTQRLFAAEAEVDREIVVSSLTKVV